MPPTPEPAFAPATVAVSAGRPPRRRTARRNPPLVMASTYHAGGEVGLRPLRQPDLGDVRERGRRAGGRGRDVVRVRDGRGRARCSTWCRSAASSWPPPDAYYGSLRDAAPAGAAGPPHGAPGRPHRRRQRRGRGARAPPWSGPSPRPTRCCGSSTSRRWPPRATRGRRAAGRRQHVRHAGRCSARWSRARTSWCTARRSTSSGHSDLLLGVAVARDADVVDRLVEVPQHSGRGPGHGRGLAGPARAAHPAPAGGAGAGERRRARRPARGPPGGRRGPLPGPGRDAEHRAATAAPQDVEAIVRGRPGCGCTRRASAASSRASSGAAGGPGRAPTCRRR